MSTLNRFQAASGLREGGVAAPPARCHHVGALRIRRQIWIWAPRAALETLLIAITSLGDEGDRVIAVRSPYPPVLIADAPPGGGLSFGELMVASLPFGMEPDAYAASTPLIDLAETMGHAGRAPARAARGRFRSGDDRPRPNTVTVVIRRVAADGPV